MSDLSPEIKILGSVGGALASWSIVELQLCAIFYTIADMKSQDKARKLFDGIISFEIRVGIVDRLMEDEQINEIEAETWRRMSARLSKMYKKRHQIAHFTLITENGEATIAPFLTWSKMNGKSHTKLEQAKIAELAEKFVELTRALNWFQDEAVRRRWTDQESLPPARQEPDLVLQLRDLAAQTLAKDEPRHQS